MVQLQDKQRIENIRHNFQIFDLSLQPTYIQQARVEATKLQIADNWAEVLKYINTFSAEFKLLVLHFWELDVFGESDFIISPAETSEPPHLEIVH
jgi:hypothetical protein